MTSHYNKLFQQDLHLKKVLDKVCKKSDMEVPEKQEDGEGSSEYLSLTTAVTSVLFISDEYCNRG